MHRGKYVLFALFAAILSAPFKAAAEDAPMGSATVPLKDLLERWTASRGAAPSPPPPVDALVQSALSARVAADALHIEARFEVKVLVGSGLRVPLLRLEPDAYVEKTPALEGATVAAVDGTLCLVAEQAGSWTFAASLIARASGAVGARAVEIVAASPAVRVPMRVEVDERAFRLVEPRAPGGTVEVFPRNGRWRVAWQATGPAKPVRPPERPPIEPRVSRASASWISTLEGLATLRVRYDLQLDREQPIVLELSEGHRLLRVAINGRPAKLPQDGRNVPLVVAPADLGESNGSLEVVLSRSWGVFHLSGQLRLELPRVSWPIAEIEARARLPAVFHYRRVGGSMEQIEESGGTSDDPEAHLPGHVLHFRQYLVSTSAPTVDLDYSVDLAGQYFR